MSGVSPQVRTAGVQPPRCAAMRSGRVRVERWGGMWDENDQTHRSLVNGVTVLPGVREGEHPEPELSR